MEHDTRCLFDDTRGPGPDRQSYRSLGRDLTLVIKVVKARQETALIQRKTIFGCTINSWLFLVARKEQTTQGQALSPAYRRNMVQEGEACPCQVSVRPRGRDTPAEQPWGELSVAGGGRGRKPHRESTIC